MWRGQSPLIANSVSPKAAFPGFCGMWHLGFLCSPNSLTVVGEVSQPVYCPGTKQNQAVAVAGMAGKPC